MWCRLLVVMALFSAQAVASDREAMIRLNDELNGRDKASTAKLLPSGCISGSFANVPETNLLTNRTISRFGDSANLKVWRVTCAHDATKSAVMARITPQVGNIFICSSAFDVLQSAIQYDSVKLVNQPGGDSFCDELIAPQSFAIDQWSFRNQFVVDDAFTLAWDGDSIVQVQVPAFQSVVVSPVQRISLEEPVNGSIVSGIANVRGWAISTAGVDRVELYVNGQYAFEIPYGGARGDVAGAFPDVPDADKSGFGLTYSYQLLGPGEHTMTARLVADDGSFTESVSTFTVVDFGVGFMAESPTVAGAASTVQANGDIVVSPVRLGNGQSYSVTLRWQTASQGFQIVAIDSL